MLETIFVHYGAAYSARTCSNLYNTLIIYELFLTFLWPKFCCVNGLDERRLLQARIQCRRRSNQPTIHGTAN
jgi:hypothetical protein